MRELPSRREVAVGAIDASDAWNRKSAVRRTALPLIVNLPWFLPTLGFWCESDVLRLVTEFCPNGTLADALAGMRNKRAPAGFGPTELAKCIFGVAFAMAAFHSRRGIHRALSARAVFLDSRFEPRIGRLGRAKIFTDPLKMTMDIGDRMHMAPELFDADAYDQSVDVFAFAVLLVEVFGPAQFLGQGGRPVCNVRQHLRLVCRGHRCERPPGMPDPFWALITDCWDQDPAKRPTFPVIVDRLKRSPELILPGTDAAAYREYQGRLEATRLDDPRPTDVIDALWELLGWDPDER
jgi:serine/threonine protein kinase